MSLVKRSADAWTVVLGLFLIAAVGVGWVGQVPAPLPWDGDPRAALPLNHAIKLLTLLVGVAVIAALGARSVSGPHDARFWGIDRGVLSRLGLSASVGAIAIVARVINHQSAVGVAALPDACIALALGLGVARALPDRVARRAPSHDVWLQLGLTVLGAELLMPKALALGVPGLVVVGTVTPIVIVAVWLVGTRWLTVPAAPRLLLIAVAGAIGGVGAVMAAAAASRARKSELGFVLLMSGVASAILIRLLPLGASALRLDGYVAGAWFGATASADNAMRAAEIFGDATAVSVAASIGEAQNAMLGLIALVLSVYWLTSVPQRATESSPSHGVANFPLAVIGMLVASATASFILSPLLGDDAMQELARGTGELRAWCFTLAAAALGCHIRGQTLMLEADQWKSFALLALGVTIDVALTLILATQIFGNALAALP